MDSASELLLAAAAAVDGDDDNDDNVEDDNVTDGDGDNGGRLSKSVRELMRSIAAIERLMDRVLRHCDRWTDREARYVHRGDSSTDRYDDNGDGVSGGRLSESVKEMMSSIATIERLICVLQYCDLWTDG